MCLKLRMCGVYLLHPYYHYLENKPIIILNNLQFYPPLVSFQAEKREGEKRGGQGEGEREGERGREPVPFDSEKKLLSKR